LISCPSSRSGTPDRDPDTAVHDDSSARALTLAEARLDAARRRRREYRGASEHMRRKLDANLRAAEYDVAILRYAVTGEGAARSVENG